MSAKNYDVAVIGGGPAGTTTASLIKKYAPDARVVLLEKAAFPRHHVGESLLPGLIPILREIGAYDRIAGAGFVRKVGATFVWGRERRPWDADLSALKVELAGRGEPTDLETAWQVPRARYDALLLERAQELGVEVLSGARAQSPVYRDAAIVGLRYTAADGRPAILSSRFLVDCSGQNGFLSRFESVRRTRDELKNVAVYGYFRGAPWKFRYTGLPNASRIFVCSAPEGWFWYIPIAADLVSVGLVSRASFVRSRAVGDMRAFFQEAIRNSRELSGLLRGRPLARGLDPADPEKDFFTVSDWSYEGVRSAGPGWYAAGDAAFFIDPLLSSGVLMAHLSAQRCAYAVLAELSGQGGPTAANAVREDYSRFCREVGAGFVDLVRIWYEHEPSAARWFAAARRRSGPLKLSRRGAFLSLVNGLDHRLERSYYTSGGAATNAVGHAWSLKNGRDSAVLLLFLTGGEPRSWRGPRGAGAPGHEDRALRTVTIVGRRDLRVGFVPIEGSGRLGAVQRVEIGRSGERVFRLLPGVYATILKAFDGRRSVIEAAAYAAQRHALPLAMIARQTLALADDLAAAGALRFGRLRPPRANLWRGRLAPLRRAEESLARGDARAAEAEAGRALRRGSGSWALVVRGLAREKLGDLGPASADLDTAKDALDATLRRKPRAGVDGIRQEFDAAVERGWLEAAVLEARLGYNERHGRKALFRADRARLDGLEINRDAIRGTVAGAGERS